MIKLAMLLNHHIDLRFLFTPFSVTQWEIKNRSIRMYYVFGVRVARIHFS